MSIIAAMTEIGNQAGNGIWPALPDASRWFDRASIVLALSLLASFAATVVIVWLGIVKEHHWDEAREAAKVKIAGLETETEKAKAEQAKANEAIATATATAATANLEAARRWRHALLPTPPPSAERAARLPVCHRPAELDGLDMRREPIEVRKATLASILRKSRPGVRLKRAP
jgi:hypothetical protein